MGAGRRDDADALVLHALIINVALGAFFSVVMLAFGRPIYQALGGRGGELDAALLYSNIVFGGNVLLWTMNALASAIRGTGNMLVPALVTCAGVVLLVPLSPCLIFGIGPFPALGIAGGGTAVVLFYAGATAVMAWYILSGRNVARIAFLAAALAVVSHHPGGRLFQFDQLGPDQRDHRVRDRVGCERGRRQRGRGIWDRLRGSNICWCRSCSGSARRWWRWSGPTSAPVNANAHSASRLIGGTIAFAVTEAVGLAAAIWPSAWLTLFSSDPQVVAAGSTYLRIVGPFYGFFGLGLALYFSSQGAGRLFWPLTGGFLRLFVATGGGWLVLLITGSLTWLFAALAFGLVVYGVTIFAAIIAGTWFHHAPQVTIGRGGNNG